ncbi:hypothetical protein [Blastopirellula marina]|uniref:LTXXQ motif protein n=1 Tax=Blastopirellula marina TaxID=124 RepID=A0A2S8GTP4_9BACT|nr:hypothetical protein [Blastopirellula marina]PQO47782.1 hypothetical protein C5Y93_01700 [Blastopirellula marina]
MSRCSTLFLFALAALVSVQSAFAADDDAAPKMKRQRKNANVGIFTQLSKIELTAEQKTEVAALRKEFAPQLVAAIKEVGMTKELRQARAAAQKEAKEKGLKGKDAREYVNTKAPLSDEQQEAQKKVNELNGKVREKLASILTDEQKETLGFNKKKPGAKKKKKAE